MAKIPKPDPQSAARYFQSKLDFTCGPIELSHWLDEGAAVNVVDVRAPEDYVKGHVPGAINLPRDQWQNPKGLSKDKANVIYCYSQTCHLAAAAALEFAKQGFPVVEMEGGFTAWQKAQLEVAVGV